MPDRPTVRFFPDWGHQWCLWCEGAVYPDELGLSKELQQSIVSWYGFWFNHVRLDGDGWDSPDALRWYNDEGDRIVERIRAEAPGFDIIDQHHE